MLIITHYVIKSISERIQSFKEEITGFAFKIIDNKITLHKWMITWMLEAAIDLIIEFINIYYLQNIRNAP